MKRNFRLGYMLAATYCMAGGSAYASELQTDGRTEEIVVTAERRASTIQDTALSIQAFGGETLLNARVADITDVQLLVPSLQVGRVGNNGVVFLRGIGTDIINVGSDNSVSFQVDNIYRSRPRDALGDFLDLERIEVLKGPQGTLYGRNAVGGAINILTNDPEPEFGGRVRAGYGNYDDVQVGAVLNIPIVADKILVRAAVQYDRNDGYTRNLFDAPGVAKALNNEDLFQSRLKVRFLPTENLTIDIVGHYAQDDSNSAAYKPEPNSANLARDVFGGRVTDNVRTVYHDVTTGTDGESWGIDGHLRWEMSDVLSLVSHTGYFNSRGSEASDRDGTEVAASSVVARDVSKSIYQDIQLAYEGAGPLRFIVGGTLFDENFTQDALIIGSRPIFGAGPPRLQQVIVEADVTFNNRAYGLYSQATYTVLDNLRLTAGLRFSSETKSYTSGQLVTGAAPVPITSFFGDQERWESFTPMVRLEYDLGDDILTYLTASRGFKSGAFNTVSSTQAPALDPETVWSYEAGAKATLFDRRLVINAALFYNDFNNLQVQVYKTGQTVAGVENASAARIYGLDLDGSLRVSNRTSLTFGLGLLSTKYKGYLTDDPFTNDVCTTPADIGCVDLSGNRLTRAPKVSATGGLQYIAPVSGGEITARADVSYKSSHYFSAFNRVTERQEGYVVANGSVSWTSRDTGLQVTLYGRNLFNKEYRVNQGASSPATPSGVYWAAPRTYGVSVDFSF